MCGFLGEGYGTGAAKDRRKRSLSRFPLELLGKPLIFKRFCFKLCCYLWRLWDFGNYKIIYNWRASLSSPPPSSFDRISDAQCADFWEKATEPEPPRIGGSGRCPGFPTIGARALAPLRLRRSIEYRTPNVRIFGRRLRNRSRQGSEEAVVVPVSLSENRSFLSDFVSNFVAICGDFGISATTKSSTTGARALAPLRLRRSIEYRTPNVRIFGRRLRNRSRQGSEEAVVVPVSPSRFPPKGP